MLDTTPARIRAAATCGRPTDGPASAGLIGIDGQTVTRHHGRHHPDTFDAFGAQSLTFFCEFGVRRIEQVRKQMYSDRPTTLTSTIARHLHPTNQADAGRQGLRRLSPKSCRDR